MRLLLIHIIWFSIGLSDLPGQNSNFKGLPRHLSEIGYPFSKCYVPADYGAFDQNWGIAQNDLGIMYFANGDGLIIFDGVTWHQVPLPNNGMVYSVHCASDQTIYYGGQGEMGFLTSTFQSEPTYVSLLPELASDSRDIGTIRSIQSTPSGVYFQSSSAIYRHHNGNIRIWASANRSFRRIFNINDVLYVSLKNNSLAYIDGDELVDIPAASETPGYFSTILPFDENKLLVGSLDGSLALFDGTSFQEFSTASDAYLKENGLSSGVHLFDSTYAFGTRFGGIVILDREGRRRMILNDPRLLTSLKIASLYQDNHGLLWAAMDFGIAKLEYPSRFSKLDEVANTDGVVMKLLRHRDQLHVATEYGIKKLIPGGSNHGPKLATVYESKDFVYDLYSFGDLLVFSTNKGIFSLEDGNLTKLTGSIQANSLQRSIIDTNRFFIGHGGGLRSMYYDQGSFRDEGNVAGVDEDIYAVVELDNGDLWLETSVNSIWNISFKDLPQAFNLANPAVRRFSSQEGLPDALGRIFRLEGDLYFRMIRGDQMYKLNVETQRFEQDSFIAIKLGLTGEVIKVIKVDEEGNIWFDKYGGISGDAKMVGWRLADKSYRVQNLNEERIYNLTGKGVYPEPLDYVVWHLSKKKIYRHDLNITPYTQPTFKTKISRITLANDSVVYLDGDPNRHATILPHRGNGFRFEYAGLYYTSEIDNHFQYQLEGYDETWSAWSTETTKDYTNINEGDYTFKVRSKNIINQVGETDSFSFTILPPWHRTWWAYLSYLLLGIVGTGGLVRWRSNQLQKEKLALLQTVNHRTAQLQVRNQQLEKQKILLSRQAKDLKQVDQLKSRLLANISHEFRTPLTLIKGPLDQLDRFPDTTLSSKNARMMHRNTDRLLRLVNQLLDLSKLDSGTLPINLVEGNLYKCLRAAASAFSSHAAQRNLDFQIRIPAENLWAAFDRDKMEEVVYNLLSNAFKFTRDDGTIIISANHHAGTLNMEVTDTGVGIPSRDQLNIFNRFYQVDNSSTKSVEGSGIGLSLVKEFVDLMKGQITLESKLNKGTSFFVSIPIIRIEKATSDPLDSNEVLRNSVIQEEASDPAEHVLDDETSSVLIVEDNADMRDYIAEQLQEQYIVFEAINGPEGLRKATGKIPDLIITDVMMPEMDGMQLCEILKTDQRTSHIPIIMLTAKAGLANKLEGLETGADVYLTKPFNVQELFITVKNLIAQRERLRKAFASSEGDLNPKALDWPTVDQEFIQAVMQLLENKMGDADFGVPAMQQALAMSKTQLHRKMKALTNHPPGEFLRNFRLKRAAQILEKGENVTQVAYAVGFNNLSYFAKCFKELYGMSPRDYSKID